MIYTFKKNKFLTFFGLIILTQFIYFHDSLSPFYWGHIKVSGLACTCPDEKVLNGHSYLRYITPDSLKKYDLDYSEIYVTERPYSSYDPMGVDSYIIEGEIIGKDRVYKGDRWNPKFKVSKWREDFILLDWIIRFLIFCQLLLWLIVYVVIKNKNSVQHKL